MRGWQWMFLLSPADDLLGLVVLRFLPDRHTDVAWLTKGKSGSRASWRRKPSRGAHTHSLRQALLMPRVWRYGLVYFSVLVGLYGFSFWLPQIIASLGSSRTAGRRGDDDPTRWLASRWCYGVDIPMRLASVRGTSRCRRCCSAGSRVGRLAHDSGGGIRRLCLAAIGRRRLAGVLGTREPGPAGRRSAGAIALINSLGNIGGFLGPFVIGMVKERTGSFAVSMLFIASCLAARASWCGERVRERRPVGWVKVLVTMKSPSLSRYSLDRNARSCAGRRWRCVREAQELRDAGRRHRQRGA